MSLKKSQFMLILCTLLLFTTSKSAHACWVGFTTEELFEKSDVILIGEIDQLLGEELIKQSDIQSIRYTKWNINVQHYIKGDIDYSQIVVGTPGSKERGLSTSIDYFLDEWESPVLLFLIKRGNFYQPLSPQGVYSLKKDAAYVSGGQFSDGYSLSKLYIFSNLEIEKYIIENVSRVKSPQNGLTIKDYNYGIFNLLVPFVVIIGVIPFLRKL